MKGCLRIGLLAVIGIAGLSLCFTVRKGVESDLFALIGSSAEVAQLRSAADAMAKSARFLVRAESEDAARARLAALGVFDGERGTACPPKLWRRRGNGERLARRSLGEGGGTGNGEHAAILTSLAPYAHGFLSQTVKGQLERGEFAAVRDAAMARMFSPIPPVLPLDKDPFLLFTDYVLEMSVPKGEWVMVNAELTPDEALATLAAVKDADDVRCAGAPFHTAVASERSKREINILSAISLFCVILFGWLLTRSFRFVPVLVGALAAAFCVAAAVLFAAFPKPHLMTFVFGTTLIGLSVDYVYHAMTARGSIAKPLTFSFLSTAVCFLPLLFSKVGVLNQMALFTLAGLATVYVGVLAFGRKGGASQIDSTESTVCAAWPRSRWRFVFACLMGVGPLLAALFCVCSGVIPMSRGVDISRFYRPDPYLAEGERIAAEATGGAGFMPSAAEQRRNANLVRRLYKAEGANLCAMTGLPEKVLALPGRFEAFDPKGTIEDLFCVWNREVGGLLTISILALCLALAAMFRRECLDFMLPILCAYCATEGLLMFMGETLNFFARICFFIFIGLGLDYCVFHWHARCGSREVGRAVRYSFLTSLVAFGMLGFTEFAVTQLMGITLAFGLAVAYFAAKLCAGGMGNGERLARRSLGEGGGMGIPQLSTPWHEQSEQCASHFWMQFMWYSYAWFGKNFQKLIFLFAMPFIYAFSKPARVALRKFYGVLSGHTGKSFQATHWRMFRHLLGFAWSLMDKTDAATLKKNLPAMSVRDDDGWRTFKGLVDSGRGAFILCTHVGTIGVLPALAEERGRGGKVEEWKGGKVEEWKGGGVEKWKSGKVEKWKSGKVERWKSGKVEEWEGGRVEEWKVHAFQQMGHDAVFMKVFMKHFDHSRIELHAVEDIGVETAVQMQEAIRRGELVILAGDRTSAGSKGVLRHRFLGRDCVWPKGAFKFAQLMEAPVFAIACVRTGWNGYEVHVAKLDGSAPLDGYVRFLESETVAHPEQWYQFYDFFGGGDD